MKDHNYPEDVYKCWYEVAELLYQQGMRHVVLSPGSRSAPPALAFLRHKGINSIVHVDERSAAFIALGIAQSTRMPVALLCTSATAALNYAPAVAEAFFREIPLLVFTADRPPEWTGQADNQAIFQKEIYGKNLKKSFELPCNLSHPDEIQHFFRLISEAWITCQFPEAGSVHINVPLREPLYLKNDKIEKDQNSLFRRIKYVDESPHKFQLPKSLLESFLNSEKVMLVAGNLPPDKKLSELITKLHQKFPAMLLLTDICSNLQEVPTTISTFENVLDYSQEQIEAYKPKLLITFGGPLVAKNLKVLLRKHKPDQHWHIHPSGKIIDTFQSLTHVIPATIHAVIKFLLEQHAAIQHKQPYANLWHKATEKVAGLTKDYLSRAGFNEVNASAEIIKRLPDKTILHLSNSLPVRIFSRLSLAGKKSLTVFANRGTSGIDGSLSTAVGSAMAAPDKMHLFISGDLSFFYDRNGLWNKALPQNLKIIVFNNHGGGIFRSMKGPAIQSELESYFAAGGGYSIEATARQHELEYISCYDMDALSVALNRLFEPDSQAAALEVFFEKKINDRALAEFIEEFSSKPC